MRRTMYFWVMACLFLSAMALAGSMDSTAPVPEPMTCLVLMAGLWIVFCGRKKSTNA